MEWSLLEGDETVMYRKPTQKNWHTANPAILVIAWQGKWRITPLANTLYYYDFGNWKWCTLFFLPWKLFKCNVLFALPKGTSYTRTSNGKQVPYMPETAKWQQFWFAGKGKRAAAATTTTTTTTTTHVTTLTSSFHPLGSFRGTATWNNFEAPNSRHRVSQWTIG